MARIAKSGLEYFPFDIDFFQDIKIRKLIKRQGGKAVTVYALLLCLIYKNGYYIQWDNDLPFIGSELSGFDEAYVSEVVKTCLTLGLFDKDLLDTDKVLTSKGIQVRYCNIQRLNKRMSRIDKYSLLVDECQQKGTKTGNKTVKKSVKAGKQVTPKPPLPPKPKPQPQPQPVSPKPTDNPTNTNAEWLKEFFANNHSENLQLLCSNFGMGPGDVGRLRKMADAVIAEWELSCTTHKDYSDWSRHLISSMRIKNREKSAQNNTNKPTETAPADYSFGGGFGGQDI